MEGPSIVIATEELKPFLRKKIADSNQSDFIGEKLMKAQSWGKHLLLDFTHRKIRIHFLMFGSYRIDDPRPHRTPKLELLIGEQRIYFYSCSIKDREDDYDFSIDTMSDEFSVVKAKKTLSRRPETKVCDALMNQDTFAGVGNIIKNEVLFLMKLHPETPLENVPLTKLIKTTVAYCHQFYSWKKENVLKRNWKIFRKKKFPQCGGKVTKRPTGVLKRISHYCLHCQKKAP
jgi:endonuclease-8